MDHFGIGAAVRGAALIYMQSARATGRTTSLVESVKDGDRVICLNSNEAKRVQRLCDERRVKVECVVIDPKTPHKLFDMPTSVGRTIFDHTWIEQYYVNAIERAQADIDHLERQSSGYGEAHRETRRRCEEIAKWGY